MKRGLCFIHLSHFLFVSVHRACIPGIPVHGIKKLEMDGDGVGNAPDSRPSRVYTRNPRPWHQKIGNGRGWSRKRAGFPSIARVYPESPSMASKNWKWTGMELETRRIPVHRACIPGIPVHSIKKLRMDGDGAGNAPDSRPRRVYTWNPRPRHQKVENGRGWNWKRARRKQPANHKSPVLLCKSIVKFSLQGYVRFVK